MAEPYIGEIRLGGWMFAPQGWAICDGSLLPIVENDSLFSLLGTTYGGDGQDTFGIPDLRGRVPVHVGALGGRGTMAGVEAVTLTQPQMPVHTHALLGNSNTGALPDPGDNVTARSHTAGAFLYIASDAPDVDMNVNAIHPDGGSQPHDNIQPFQCITYVISLFGIFPQKN